MATTILRFEKLKVKAQIHKAGSHHHRFSKTPNADPNLYYKNKILVGSINTVKDVYRLIEHYKVKPRKNAVLAMDTLLTLSPEIFQTINNTSTFEAAAIGWLKKKFGLRCVNAVLHLDETTPHIHAIIVPLDKNKEGKVRLNARDLFNPLKLSEYQREFNAHMHKIFPQIIPPKHGNKVTHKKIKSFYEELTKDAAKLKEKQLKLYELELKRQQKLLITKFIEKCIPILDIWGNKLENELRADVGDHSKKLKEKYENSKKVLKFELEEAFSQDPELLVLKKGFENKFK